jgi:hypothetical protein
MLHMSDAGILVDGDGSSDACEYLLTLDAASRQPSVLLSDAIPPDDGDEGSPACE